MKPIQYTKLPLFSTTLAYASGEHVYVESVSGVTDGHYVSNEAISAGSFDSTKWTYVDGNHYVAQGLPQYTVDSAMSSSSENPVQNKVIKSYVDEHSPFTLLWTNSSPTSEFSAQDISLDLSDYSFVLVVINDVGTPEQYDAWYLEKHPVTDDETV